MSTPISQYPSPHHLSFKRDVPLGSILLGCLFYLAGRAHLWKIHLHWLETQEMWVWYLVRKIPLEEEMAPTPAFLPGESHARRGRVGHSPWGGNESDSTCRLNHNQGKNRRVWGSTPDGDPARESLLSCQVSAWPREGARAPVSWTSAQPWPLGSGHWLVIQHGGPRRPRGREQQALQSPRTADNTLPPARASAGIWSSHANDSLRRQYQQTQRNTLGWGEGVTLPPAPHLGSAFLSLDPHGAAPGQLETLPAPLQTARLCPRARRYITSEKSPVVGQPALSAHVLFSFALSQAASLLRRERERREGVAMSLLHARWRPPVRSSRNRDPSLWA